MHDNTKGYNNCVLYKFIKLDQLLKYSILLIFHKQTAKQPLKSCILIKIITVFGTEML